MNRGRSIELGELRILLIRIKRESRLTKVLRYFLDRDAL